MCVAGDVLIWFSDWDLPKRVERVFHEGACSTSGTISCLRETSSTPTFATFVFTNSRENGGKPKNFSAI